MFRFLPATSWTILLYGLTIATAGLPVGPVVSPNATAYEISRSSWWFELNHAVLHAATFAVLAGLIFYAYRADKINTRQVAVILIAALLVGVGQELIQAAARSRLAIGNSIFDVICDLSGASASLLALIRRVKHELG